MYLADGDAHDGSDKPRNWFSDGLGCMPETAEAEWKAVRQKFGKDGVRLVSPADGGDGFKLEGEHVQSVHVALSYDKSEYDPTDLAAVERAHQQSLETAERTRDGHQVVVKTQTDGRTGHVHSHLLYNAIHPSTGRAMNGRGLVRNIDEFRRITNEVAAEFFGERHNEKLMAERAQSVRLNASEQAVKDAGEYVWKDDLAKRLDKALTASTTRDEWKAQAAETGVEIRFRGKGTSFGFTDADGEQRDVRASGLGTRWRSKNVDQSLAMNAEQRRMQAFEERREVEAGIDAQVEAQIEQEIERQEREQAKGKAATPVDRDKAAIMASISAMAAEHDGEDVLAAVRAAREKPAAAVTEAPEPKRVVRKVVRRAEPEKVATPTPTAAKVPTVAKTDLLDHPEWFRRRLRDTNQWDRYAEWHAKAPARLKVAKREGLPAELAALPEEAKAFACRTPKAVAFTAKGLATWEREAKSSNLPVRATTREVGKIMDARMESLADQTARMRKALQERRERDGQSHGLSL